jgi:hypothetical protein
LARFIAVIEMIRARIVEIDRLLHEAKPKRPAVEIEVALGRPGDGGDMMNSVWHGENPRGSDEPASDPT